MGARERVYGTVDYHDGVIGGVADFRGRPHAFELDAEADAESPIYRLAPIPDLSLGVWKEGRHAPVNPGTPVRARGRFLPRDENERGEDGVWALDVEWLDDSLADAPPNKPLNLTVGRLRRPPAG